MKNILFWIIAGVVLILYFSIRSNSLIQTFYFVSFLLPIAVATSYLMNELIVPKFYITKRYLLFSLYTLYLLITSLFFQILIIVLSLVIFETFQKEGYNNFTVNVLNLNLFVYILILINGFIHLLQLGNQKDFIIEGLKKNLAQSQSRVIHVRYNRQNFPIKERDIVYIESRTDYINIITTKEEIITKQTISSMERELSDSFIRTHRSFIVNRDYISSYNKEFISLGEVQLPISRTYKKRVLEKIALLD